ncbi:MAG: N-acetyl-gamma-glutamyl-phosphate reductase [Actinomycetota bacterium]|nr:N-acetyl-gamma-glutamyl-phosphate reductase [Actinomycetota bacterium]
MGLQVAVAGASGYAGGELLRLLSGHPALELASMTAHAAAGSLVCDLHPHLPSLAGRPFVDTDPAALSGADLVFLALPHGASAPLVAGLPPDVRVVDLGADHRLADPAAWSQWYDGPHAGVWPYGLPELPGARATVAAATRIAAPGCYPTAVAIGLAPLLAAGLVEPADLVVIACSGVSGAGREARPNLLAGEVIGDIAAYGVGGGHRHVPEMIQTLTTAAAAPVSLSFTPVLAPMPRGILATCTARLASGADAGSLRAALAAAYGPEPLVHLLPEGRWPHTAATLGSAAAHLQVTADAAAGRAVVVVALDNLGKGAAAQAVQCANLMLGLPETAGLSSAGVAP